MVKHTQTIRRPTTELKKLDRNLVVLRERKTAKNETCIKSP